MNQPPMTLDAPLSGLAAHSEASVQFKSQHLPEALGGSKG